MLHELLKTWFEWVEQWSYWGVFVLMAMESSIIPVPSELVMPPAGFWAAQGKMSFWGVVLSGTAGSYFGSMASYYLARLLGLPFIERYGKFVLLSSEKIHLAENWVTRYATGGVFFARLLPVVRHLISIPAGIFKMRILPFSVVTIAGALIWNWILAFFGAKVIGDRPELLNSPEEMVGVMKDRLSYFILFIGIFALLYILVLYFKNRSQKKDL